MKNRYSFYEEANDDIIGKHPGFVSVKDLKAIFSGDDDIFYKIPVNHQYRPDLISQKFYNTTKLHWIITFINEIEKSPEDYTVNRILRIPKKERVYQAL